MKLDKDTLVKHHFWIMLAVALPLSIAAILTLLTAVSADISSKRNQLDQDLNGLRNQKVQQNQETVSLAERIAELKKRQESEVHAYVWKLQETISTWPDRMEQLFNFKDGKFATDITVRKQPPDGWPKDGPKDEPNRLVHGIVKDRDKEYLILQTADKKEERIHRHARGKVTFADDSNAVGHFFAIKRGDWVAVQYDVSKYFNDPLTDTEQSEFDQSYTTQFWPNIEQVEPMNERGEGVVQLKGWFYRKGELPPAGSKFFIYKPDKWRLNVDFSDEAWIAQEDLWIQREVYRLVRLANDYVSKFKPEKEADLGGKAASFTNPYWKLDVKVAGNNKLNVKLTNLLPRRQKLEVAFLVRMGPNRDGPPERIYIEGEPLDPRGTTGDWREATLPITAGRTGIFGVEQVLTWETAAVKRIDAVAIGSNAADIGHAHRTFPLGVRAYKDDKAVVQADPEKQEAKQAGPGNVGPNGLVRTRYVQVTPQARRLPLAVSLIVDQDHVDRVQAAFNNSYLRFVTTQVLMNRFPQSMRPQITGLPATPAPMLQPDFQEDAPRAPTSVAALLGTDEQEANIELNLYGIISLYERFPPRPAPQPQ